jgi:hypothetical protein
MKRAPIAPGRVSLGGHPTEGGGVGLPVRSPREKVDVVVAKPLRARSASPPLDEVLAHWFRHSDPTTASGGPMPKPAASLAISVAPSPQRSPKLSTLAGAASFGHGTGMRLGSEAIRCLRGQSWATSSTIFCCSPVWHYSSRGLSSRPRACSSDAAPLLSDAPRAVCAST